MPTLETNVPPLTERGCRARALAIDLVEHLSVTGTPGEVSFAAHIHAILGRIAYFAAKPDHLSTALVDGEPEGRANVIGLVRGRGRRTVVLAGHFDVVSVDNYLALSALAHRPEPLSRATCAALAESGEAPHVLRDLSSGDFLAGRGLLDMKSGLAAGIVALETFAARPEREGNLVLLACPDEENQSAGMRAAGPRLKALAEEHGLDLALLINLDAVQDDGDVAAGQIVGLGCIGKHLVTALVVGREAHACYPFTGINAAYLAAALAVEAEAHPALSERVGDEVLAPPAALLARDLKSGYDVTTPERCWCAWNVLVYEQSARAVTDTFLAIAGDVARRALERLAARAAETGIAFRYPSDVVTVTTYAAVHAAAIEAAGDRYRAERSALASRLAADGTTTIPDKARRLTELAIDTAGLNGPAIVLGFGSLSYPAVLSLSRRGLPALDSAVREAAAGIAERHRTTVGFVEALPIICDMSFAAAPADPEDHRHALENNPLSEAVLSWDVAAVADVPSINIGPWGRGYHHRFERVNVRYAFDVLPDLVLETADRVLTAEASLDPAPGG